MEKKNTNLSLDKELIAFIEQFPEAVCITDLKTPEILLSNTIWDEKQKELFKLIDAQNETPYTPSNIDIETIKKLIHETGSCHDLNADEKSKVNPTNRFILKKSILPFNNDKYKLYLLNGSIANQKNLNEILLAKRNFDCLFHYSPTGIVKLSENFTIENANQAFVKMLGADTGEVLNKKLEDFSEEESREKIIKQFKEVKSKELHNCEFECLLMSKKGKYIWTQIYLTKIDNPNNEQSFFLCRVLNVSDKKNREEALIQSEQKYRFLTENSSDIIWQMNLDYEFTFVNASVQRMFGCDVKDWLGSKISDHTSTSEFLKIARVFGETLKNHKTSKVFKIELSMLRNDKSEFPAEINGNLLFDDKNQPRGIQGTIRDISDRVVSMKQLALSEEKNKTYLESSIIGICLTDQKGDLFYANRALTDLLGYSLSEIKATNFSDFIFEKNLVQFANRQKLLKNLGSINFETVVKQRNNQPLNVRINAAKISNGEIMYFIEDISMQKEAEKELIQARDKAEESDKLKTSFLKTMSHELRTPLNAIIGFSDILITSDLDPEKYDMVDIIKKSGKNLLDIIEAIFYLIELETKPYKPNLVEYGLIDLVNNLKVYSENTLRKLKKPHVEIVVEVPDGLEYAMLHADIDNLKKVLLNLIENAAKFTSKGSITIGCWYVNCDVVFYVKDTGIGIQKEYKDIIFEKFRQIDSSDTRKYEGIGLGLTLCKRITDILKGELWFDSERGKGTSFYCRYNNILHAGKPESKHEVSEDELCEESSNASCQKPDLSGLRVLVAEDDVANFLLLSEILKSRGAVPVHMHDGKEAVEFVKSHKDKIDLILMDLKMPRMNGFVATQVIKTLIPDIPIIAQTAYALEEEKNKSKLAGCDDYIEKPINATQLYKKVVKYTKAKVNNPSNA